MEPVLLISIVAFAISLFPLAATAVLGWLRQDLSAKVHITVGDSAVRLDKLDRDQVYRILLGDPSEPAKITVVPLHRVIWEIAKLIARRRRHSSRLHIQLQNSTITLDRIDPDQIPKIIALLQKADLDKDGQELTASPDQPESR